MDSTSSLFTVGKVDAGLAILLTEDNHLIEFPSILLPEGVSTGAIVKVQVSREYGTEKEKLDSFMELQEEILLQYGTHYPKPPAIKISAITQTSIVLEWEPLELFSCDLRSFTVYKKGIKMPSSLPTQGNKLKISGLDMDTLYDLSIIMSTSSGVYTSNKVEERTLTLSNLSGINVCLDSTLSSLEIEELKKCVQRIGAKWSTEVSIETTDLLCNSTVSPNYELALQWNVAIVKPDWLKACEALGKIQPAVSYYVEPAKKG
ncbi:BRCT domain-containing protein [Neoconidiobolus thromboides FSU 785]|nr:BRCT domain-containing protein [Neoconidiobolus thromboides FSU 785]